MMLATLESLHPFTSAAEALAAADAPHEWEQANDHGLMPAGLTERALAAGLWLAAHPVEAATTRIDRAQTKMTTYRDYAAKAPNDIERRACLEMAAEAADDLSFQLSRLARLVNDRSAAA